ncbi:GNAT family N-acetyltransferase [Halorubrum halodurans]|uniref:N-acetyltransferase domain-containing protein n=1 Tax=Halorubrum halodurans TaxID=1383851 RepID=A0A256IH34_9EURY|nr:GNAT family N-acetyltransferase [Halorubrum halodurans]OYR55793.1 hypothetical protein DJ70_10745 [Halorubrum halodurans]
MSNTQIRPIEDEDIPEFLDLVDNYLSEISNELWDTDWFRWKYDQNPWTPEIAATVAVEDGEIIGGVGFVPVPMEFEGSEFLGISPTDLVIHPDHRGGMTFSELVERGMEEFADHNTWLTYGQPREDTVDVWTRLRGWSEVETVPRSWRINRIQTFVGDLTENKLLSTLSMAGQPIFLSANLIDRATRKSTDPSVTVSAYESVPSELLQDLYETISPSGLQINRNKQFYEWRLSKASHADYRTFVARKDGDVVGALTTSQWRTQDVVKIVDLLPINCDSPTDKAIVRSLVVVALKAHRKNGAIRASLSLPEEILAEFGFVRTRQMKQLMEWGPLAELAGEAVPSWDLHFAGKVLEQADLTSEEAERMLDWRQWNFTGIEIDTA